MQKLGVEAAGAAWRPAAEIVDDVVAAALEAVLGADGHVPVEATPKVAVKNTAVALWAQSFAAALHQRRPSFGTKTSANAPDCTKQGG